jgi:hypothetical protein
MFFVDYVCINMISDTSCCIWAFYVPSNQISDTSTGREREK